MSTRFSNIASIVALAVSLTSLSVTLMTKRDAKPPAYDEVAVSLPKPSLAKQCLPVSLEGENKFVTAEVESSDFCAPGGASIQSVTVSNIDAWAFSQPWADDNTISGMSDRIAFARKHAAPGDIDIISYVSIQTEKGIYNLRIESDPAAL